MVEHWMADQSFEQHFHDIFTADMIEEDNIVIFQGHFFEKDVLSTTLCVEDGCLSALNTSSQWYQLNLP
jgi:hypothetical protein